MSQDILFIDCETFAKIDLPEAGLDNYARAAKMHMLAWAINRRKINVWFPRIQPMPDELRTHLLSSNTIKIAWNAQFERTIFRYVLGLDIPINQWRDPLVLARSLSLPGGLGKTSEILKLDEDVAKMADGKRLIKLFCEPNGEEGVETLFGVSSGFNDETSHPADWKIFVDYCIRDVEAERALWYQMLPLSFPESMWEDWFLDQEMNDFGVPVNVERVKKALRLAERYKAESKLDLNRMTGLENANSNQQLLEWLKPQGYSWGSVNKTFVDAELNNPKSSITQLAREVLILRRKASQTSYTKLEKILAQVGPDGFLRYQFAFLGAARTGRWSSSGGAQLQNMPRPIKAVKKADPAYIFDLIDREAYDEIIAKFDGSTLPFVASIIRMMFEVHS